MDERLLRAITTPSIQGQASELVRLSLLALDDLRQLDESLYARFVASKDQPEAADAKQTGLRILLGLRALWEETFGGLQALLTYCRTIADGDDDDPTVIVISEGDDEIDFGELDGPAPVKELSGELDLGAGDIGDLLDGIDEQPQEGDADKWAKVRENASSIEYGLRTQYVDALSRMNIALAGGEINQVLGLLDDTQSTANEAVHALVAAVYQAFVPDIDASNVVPGYLTTLSRALLVRRGIAELGATLTPHNEVLQSGESSAQAGALATMREVMSGFVASAVCRAMRAADRWQMVEFERELTSQPAGAARQTAEGLVKYLDSLGSINQREVLLVHDRRTLDEMQEALTAARQLVDLSPRTASEMLDRAYQGAQRLRGRGPATDQLIVQLEQYAPTSSSAADALQFLERLETLVAAAGG